MRYASHLTEQERVNNSIHKANSDLNFEPLNTQLLVDTGTRNDNKKD